MRIFEHGYSTAVDGKGTRLIFYLKGCNFSCDWCGAPESISYQIETLHYPNRQVIAGNDVSPRWVIDKALRCRDLVDGVTFGGGEPTLQGNELAEVLQELRNNSIHTALESNGSTDAYRSVIALVDQLFTDLKTLSPELFASRINPDITLLEKVKDNLLYAALNHKDLTIRIPVITDLNDTVVQQEKIADYLADLQDKGGGFKVELLKQHHIAEPKYHALQRKYLCQGIAVPGDQVMENFTAILKQRSIKVI